MIAPQSHDFLCYFWGFVSVHSRGMKDVELDASSMEKRFAYKFLKKILKYVDSAQEFIAHLGKSSNTQGRIFIPLERMI